MKKILLNSFLALGALYLTSCEGSSPNPCLMSEGFIKKDLNYPDEAEFPMLDCQTTDNGSGNYTVLRKITAKNAFGVETSYIYKLELKYKGGIDVDQNNWELISMQSEKAR